MLGVPCATTRLCVREGRRGSLSLSVVPEGQYLWEGKVVLEAAQAPGYFPHIEGEPGVDRDRPDVRRPGHSLTNIRDALSDVAVPPNFDGPESLTGYEVFAGYMILDALIANRDRHEQNWAILAPALLSGAVRLAPSYDHASGLGYNLPDSKRERCVEEPRLLESWANKGTAYRFEQSRTPPTLVSHAAQAVSLCTPEGANWWRERVVDCDLTVVQQSLQDHAIVEMSDLAAKFASDLLDLNVRRIRDALYQRS